MAYQHDSVNNGGLIGVKLAMDSADEIASSSIRKQICFEAKEI